LISGLLLQNIELAILRYFNNKKNMRKIFLNIGSGLFIINIFYYKGQGLSKKKASNICYLYTSVFRLLLLFIILVDSFIN
jgi:hypothetical protein